jgi:hypothetical protein
MLEYLLDRLMTGVQWYKLESRTLHLITSRTPITEAQMRDIATSLHLNLAIISQRYHEYADRARSVGTLYAQGDNTIPYHIREFRDVYRDLTCDIQNFNTQAASFDASLRRNPINGLSAFPLVSLAHVHMNSGYYDAGGNPSVTPFTPDTEGRPCWSPGSPGRG